MVDWQQGAPIFIACIFIGAFVGFLFSISYLMVTRLLRRPFSKEYETSLLHKKPLEPVVPDAVAQLPKKEPFKAPSSKKGDTTKVVGKPRESIAPSPLAEKEPFKKPLSRRGETTPVVKEPQKPAPPDLFAEVEKNHRIATEPWTGELRPFQTDVWDASQAETHKLTANLQEDLIQAYVDMHLANNIVWLLTELGLRSRNLDKNYMQLCASVAARLDRVTALLTQSSN